MKTSLKLITSVASFAALLTGAFAQTTAVTDPVGYVTVNVNAGSAAVAGFSAIAPTLVQKTEFQAVGAISVDGLTVTVAGLTAGAYDKDGALVKYYLEIADGTHEGKWVDIASNLSGSITLNSPIDGGGTSPSIRVRKHMTIADFLGASNTAGLLAGEDPTAADEVIFMDAAGNFTSYFYSTLAGLTGWRDSAYEDASVIPIKPGQGVFVARKTSGTPSFTVVGHVKTTKTQITVNPGYNLVGVTHATGLDLNTSGLEAGLISGEDPTSSDEVLVLNPDGSFSNWFNSTLAGLTGWRDNAYEPFETADIIAEGRAYLIQHKAATTTKPVLSKQVITVP